MKSIITRTCIATLLLGISTASYSDTVSVLDVVKKNDHVRCGINEDLPGFSEQTANDSRIGFDIDLCRAVAAAVLGDAAKVKFISVSASDRFTDLAAGKFDLLARNSTWNLSRDTSMGVNFVAVSYYDGQGFLVRKSSGYRSALELNDVKICAEDGTTHIKNLKDYFSINRMKYTLRKFASADASLAAFEQGQCEVLTSDQSSLYALRTRLQEPDSARVLPEVISKEPLGPVVADGDDQWASIVRWSLYVMLNAEELGISSANIDRVREVSRIPAIRRLLGLEGDIGKGLELKPDWAYQVIKQVGNYAESFDRNIGKGSALQVRRGLNAVWRSGGLHYAPPID